MAETEVQSVPSNGADATSAVDEAAAQRAQESLQTWMDSAGDVKIAEAEDKDATRNQLDFVSKDPAVPNPVWQELDSQGNLPICRKCKMPVDVTMCVHKVKSEPKSNVICRGCNAATTMLSRNLSKWPLPSFPELSEDSQISFWRKCGQMIQENGKLQYHNLRGALSMTLEERHTEVNSCKFSNESLPLSVWEARGFDPEKVKLGKKEEHPILGECYSVTLKTMDRQIIKKQIEAMISSFEAKAQATRGSRGSGSQKRALETTDVSLQLTNEPDAEDLALEWMEGSPGKVAKPPVPIAEDEPDPKKARKEAAARQKKNTSIQKLAKKSLETLKPISEKMNTVLANKDILPAKILEDLYDLQQCMKGLVDECTEKGFKQLTDKEELESLSFSPKDLGTASRDWKARLSKADRVLALIQKVKV